MSKPKKKPPGDDQIKPKFKVMLHMDEKGVAHWMKGAKSYFETISLISQRDCYCMASNREQDARREFTRQQNAPPPEPKKKKRDVVNLEKQYGNMVRNLYRKRHVSVEDLARQFGLNVSDVKMMVREE